ncbi:hypothetical protein RRG08_016199 [Elysia crispata]|uniref:Uncharacterized protein n=1 Tax=Elysia crispata TaxID=231223 RepID=A0AAE0ZPJ6_9GAST|nr:hypothetical protein RRG08_016199 [Elysia crispata]
MYCLIGVLCFKLRFLTLSGNHSCYLSLTRDSVIGAARGRLMKWDKGRGKDSVTAINNKTEISLDPDYWSLEIRTVSGGFEFGSGLASFSDFA